VEWGFGCRLEVGRQVGRICDWGSLDGFSDDLEIYDFGGFFADACSKRLTEDAVACMPRGFSLEAGCTVIKKKK
jgi:hypothetical protein